MRDTLHIMSLREAGPAATSRIMLFLLAIHAPALMYGGNRFGLIAPSAVILLVLLWQTRKRNHPLFFASWLWIGVMVWGGGQIALGLTPDHGEAARILVRFALYAAIYLIAADIARRPLKGNALIKATAVWISLICIYGLVAWSTGVNPVLAELEAYPDPLEATFINRNAFALYAVFGLLASLAAGVGSRQGFIGFANGGWAWAAAAAICATTLVLTGSRGGLGAGLAGVAVFAFITRRRRLAAIFVVGALFCAGLLGETFFRETSLLTDPRFTIHAQVFAETAKAPLTGHGLGAFQDTFRASVGAEWRWGDWDHAHQQYLETAYEIGWPAAIALFAAIILAAPDPMRKDPHSALALAALTAAAAHALVDFSLTIPSVAMTLALLLGLASNRQGRAR